MFDGKMLQFTFSSPLRDGAPRARAYQRVYKVMLGVICEKCKNAIVQLLQAPTGRWLLSYEIASQKTVISEYLIEFVSQFTPNADSGFSVDQ